MSGVISCHARSGGCGVTMERFIKMDNGAQTAKVKMSGYLCLKIKKRMMSSWKNYWFVLEGRLLLYYRSKDEYEAISPCKGSINLGPPCVVKSLPSVPNSFQIETRTITYTLKAENSDEQKKWMQIILSALNQNQNFNPEGAKRLSHFRYSLDDLIPEVEPNDSKVLHKTSFERQNTMPNPQKSPKDNNEIIQRLQKIGAHSYGGSLEAISKMVTKKVSSPTVSENVRESVPEEGVRGEVQDEKILRHRRVCGDNIYERISGDSQYSDRGSFLVDNENYSVPIRKSVSVVEKEAEKSPLVQSRETKSLLVENDQYEVTRHVQSEEAIYSEPKVAEQTDCNKNSVIVENSFYASTDVINRRSAESENLYEDLDKFSHYSQPIIKSCSVDETSSQSSVECSKACNEKKKEENSRPLKKSKSFIKRMWKKKKSKKEDVEEKQEEEEIYAEIDPSAVEKVSVSDENAIQMLSELQNILEKQKTKMKTPTTVPCDRVENDSKLPTTTTDSEKKCPSLPPKTHKISQDTVSKQPVEKVRSLDEILEDLDKEKMESKSKVQMLIEKFSEPEGDVILRKHDKPDFKVYRHSDELNKLLNELAKVTSAPIMTPGVTSSLVNPNLSDDEWLKLLPVRQRRLSEPDYDVPRLHRSIQLPVKTESENSDTIPATRFFGPVLPTTITENKEKEESPHSAPVSMTPDSLEVEEQQKYEPHYSYTSHNYNNYNNNHTELKRFSQNYNQQDDKIIYAMPKSYVSVATHIVNTCQNICGAQMTDECTIIYKTVKNVEVQEEIFKDSLELCNETSTEF